MHWDNLKWPIFFGFSHIRVMFCHSLRLLFYQMSQFHYSNVRVKFDGEDGSGPGVNRGFFASLSNDLKTSDVSKTPLNRLGLFFHEPGKQPEQSGLFAPHPFMPHIINSPSRASVVKVTGVSLLRRGIVRVTNVMVTKPIFTHYHDFVMLPCWSCGNCQAT